MKKTVVLLILTAMLFSCLSLVACNGGKTPPPAGSDTTETEGAQNPNSSTSLDVGKDLGYEGSFIIMTYKTDIPEFCDQDLERPDAVEAALIERDRFVESYLGVEMLYDVSTPGNYPERAEFSNKVRMSVQNGLKSFDLIAAYSMVPPNLALEGVLVDMNTLDHVNLDKTWYPQFMRDACTINDQTYFMTGDISSQSLFRMLGVAFSPTLAANNGISEETLYQMVYDGNWTYENWFGMCEELTTDGGDGQWDAGDFYPIQTSSSASIDAFFPSTGMTIYEKDDKGLLKVSGDILSEKALDFYQMFYDAKNTLHVYKDGYDEKLLVNKKCIFQVCAMSSFRLYFEEADETFCVLPAPKYESGENTEYITWLASHIQYCIPNDINDPNRSAAVFEVMGYAGYTYVVPAIFEKTFKQRYSPTLDVANMFDIMRNGRTYDAAGAFFMTFEARNYNDVCAFFRYAVQKNITNWSGVYKNDYEVGLHNVCRAINEFYSKTNG